MLLQLLLLLAWYFFPLTHALQGTATDHSCAVEWRPSVTGWKSGQGYCQNLGGRLCTRNEYCPLGINSIPSGGFKTSSNGARQWAPTSDGINTWVMLSNQTNTNGHVVIVNEIEHDTGEIQGPACALDSSTSVPTEWTSASSATDISVTCCSGSASGSLVDAGPARACLQTKTYLEALDHCATLGKRLCNFREIQVGTFATGGGCDSLASTRTWTSTSCTTNFDTSGIPIDPRPLEHPENSCSLSTESGSESYDQIGESDRYTIMSPIPSSTAGDAPKLVDGSDTTYWEPGVDVGSEFVLNLGQVYNLGTHVRIVSSNVDSFDIAVFSSYQGSAERKYLNNFTVTPGTDVYTLSMSEDVITTQVEYGARLYWIYIVSKTGTEPLRIHEIAILSRSSPNPAWGMSDMLGRSFLGHVKCCDVPASNMTDVVLSNVEGGGSDVGGWSCTFRNEEMDSVHVGVFIDTWYDTSDGCDDPATGGIPCTQQMVDSDVECANRCGITFSRLKKGELFICSILVKFQL